MKKQIKSFVLIVTSLVLSACCAPPVPQAHFTEQEGEVKEPVSESITLETIDNWEIPRVALPRVSRAVQSPSRVPSHLNIEFLSALSGDDDLEAAELHPEYEVLESPLTRIQLERHTGRIHMRTRAKLSSKGPAVALNQNFLREEALLIGESLGIARVEVGDVIQRTLQRDAEDENGERVTDLLGHITFIERRIGDVPVLGSRMVVMHDREGNLAKVMGWWPEIDMEGSRLNREFSRAQTTRQVSDTLRFHSNRLADPVTGRTLAGRVDASPVLVPVEQEDGTVRLNLQLEMDIRSSLDSPEFKPLQIHVDI